MVGHEPVSVKVEFDYSSLNYKKGKIESAAGAFAINYVFATEEFKNKRAVFEGEYTISGNDLIGQNGESFNGFSVHESAAYGAQLRDVSNAFGSDPSVTQQIFVSADDPSRTGIVGDPRSYVYIYTRDINDPKKIHLVGVEAPPDEKDLIKFLSEFGKTPRVIGYDGNRPLFETTVLRDDSRPITFERIAECAVRAFGSDSDPRMIDYVQRVTYYFSNRETILEAQKMSIDQLTREVIRRSGEGPNVLKNLERVIAEKVDSLNGSLTGLSLKNFGESFRASADHALKATSFDRPVRPQSSTATAAAFLRSSDEARSTRVVATSPETSSKSLARTSRSSDRTVSSPPGNPNVRSTQSVVARNSDSSGTAARVHGVRTSAFVSRGSSAFKEVPTASVKNSAKSGPGMPVNRGNAALSKLETMQARKAASEVSADRKVGPDTKPVRDTPGLKLQDLSTSDSSLRLRKQLINSLSDAELTTLVKLARTLTPRTSQKMQHERSLARVRSAIRDQSPRKLRSAADRAPGAGRSIRPGSVPPTTEMPTARTQTVRQNSRYLSNTRENLKVSTRRTAKISEGNKYERRLRRTAAREGVVGSREKGRVAAQRNELRRIMQALLKRITERRNARASKAESKKLVRSVSLRSERQQKQLRGIQKLLRMIRKGDLPLSAIVKKQLMQRLLRVSKKLESSPHSTLEAITRKDEALATLRQVLWFLESALAPKTKMKAKTKRGEVSLDTLSSSDSDDWVGDLEPTSDDAALLGDEEGSDELPATEDSDSEPIAEPAASFLSDESSPSWYLKHYTALTGGPPVPAPSDGGGDEV